MVRRMLGWEREEERDCSKRWWVRIVGLEERRKTLMTWSCLGDVPVGLEVGLRPYRRTELNAP